MNSNLLRARIRELGKTQSEVAVEAKMSENSLSRNMSGKRDFKLSEVERICFVLQINDPKAIFLIGIPNYATFQYIKSPGLGAGAEIEHL